MMSLNLTAALLGLLFACGEAGHDEHKGHDAHGDHAEHGEAGGHDDHDEGAHGEEAEAHADVVTLTPEAIASARIETAPAASGALSEELSLAARIALDPTRESLVSAWIGGQVDAIRVRTGDAVSRGATLATVQSPELGGAVGDYRGALARDQAADARLERLQRLERDGVASRAQVLEAEADHAEALGALEAAEERLRVMGVDLEVGDPHAGEHFPSRVPIRSPIAGKILTTDIAAGQRVEPGDALFRVGDLDEVWLLVDVYERELSRVAPGQEIRFTVDAWPGEDFTGVVEQVGDWIEPEARTVEVRAVVPNPDHRLKPNMFAQATLSVEGAGDAQGILLPAGAVQIVEGRPSVFVQEAPGRFAARAVELAAETSAFVLVGAGLEVGEVVVTEGAFALRSELEKGSLGHGHAH